MFRRSSLPAAASLAVVLLAVTGCKIQVSGAATDFRNGSHWSSA